MITYILLLLYIHRLNVHVNCMLVMYISHLIQSFQWHLIPLLTGLKLCHAVMNQILKF